MIHSVFHRVSTKVGAIQCGVRRCGFGGYEFHEPAMVTVQAPDRPLGRPFVEHQAEIVLSLTSLRHPFATFASRAVRRRTCETGIEGINYLLPSQVISLVEHFGRNFGGRQGYKRLEAVDRMHFGDALVIQNWRSCGIPTLRIPSV